MKDLVVINDGILGNGVDARQLHAKLEVKTEFSHWIKRRLEECLAVEGVDFLTIVKKDVRKNGRGTTNYKDYIISLDIAKQFCMMERTELGRQARLYFIECEKRYLEMQIKAIPRNYKEALQALIESEEEREQLREEKKVLARRNGIIEHSHNSYTATQIAKELDLPSAQFLNSILHRERIQYKQGKNWIPYAGYESWYSIKEVINNEQEQSYITTRFTLEGKIQVTNLLVALGIIEE